MGKKYIIELESGTHMFVLGPEGIVHIGEPDVVYETVDGMEIGDAVINAKPYTEPDLEQVREEAYEDGYKTAKVQCNIQAEKDLREVGERHYQKGLEDIWRVARKIILPSKRGGFTIDEFAGCFGSDVSKYDVVEHYSASEAIEKIRQYEQEQEEIHLGDEVTFLPNNAKGIVTECHVPDISDIFDKYAVWCGGTMEYVLKQHLTKTGRTFPEIAEILQKMKEES